ncbi:uncharacterized protein isoform X2 [Rhodnius prolixus]|uniref:uncharacterized protein isoform X2 n=1 Tax=Rhodnius prolixus TaxID=13249 RepID=UPI003D18F536
MDQVSFNLPASNIFVLNGQTVLFQNGTLNSQAVNGDFLQEEVFNKECSPKQLSTEVKRGQQNTYEGCGFVIVKGAQKENNCNLVQLTVQEAAELGIQFSTDNAPKSDSVVEVPNNKSQNLLFQKVGGSVNEKVNASRNAINCFSNGNLDDNTKIPCASKNVNELTLVPQYVNGQIAYAVQLTGTDQVHTSQNIGIPISVPTMEVQSVASADNDFNKFVSPVTVKTVINNPNKKLETSKSSTSLQTFAPNPKIRILSKVKHQELKKSNQRKIIPLSKDKYIINRQRKLAPQKILLPPLTKVGQEVNNDTKLLRASASDFTDATKQTVPTNGQNQSLFKVLKENEQSNEKNSPGIAKKTNSSPLKFDCVQPKKVQLLTVPQGSQDAKKIVSVPNDKSGKKLTPSQLMQIATVLQKNRLNRQSSLSNASTLYDLETNTRIICRVLYPEDFKPEVEKTPVVTNVKKRGRPNKKEQVEVGAKEEKSEKGKGEKGTDRVPARTRSGRVTRPPRHMVEDYKRLKGDDSDGTYSDYQSGTDENIENSPAVNLLPGLNLHQKRNFSSQFRCPTCNKIYLGRVRMALHFTKYPDHCDSKQLELLKESAATREEGAKATWRKGLVSSRGKGKAQRKMLGRLALDKVLDSYNENEVVRTCGRRVAGMLSTWEMLLLRLESKVYEGKCKVQAFLDELESLVKSVRVISQQILRPPNCDPPNVHLEDDTIATVLGVEKGWYTSDECGLPQPLVDKEQSAPKQHNLRSSDEDCSTTSVTETHSNLCKDEQDVVKVKEELSELDLSCVQDDPIGVDSVDQIVSERLKTMAPVEDLVSTLPAMPATSTDDLVRGLLTDDLINSLETFIPPTHPPPDLDFTVLSSEFSSPR